MKNNLIITIILVVLVGAGAFFAGMKYQQSQRGSQLGANGANRGQFRQGLGQNGQAVRGEILSADDKSVTVKMSDGSSKLVILSGSTSIIEATSAAKTELQAGKQVAVFGTTNSDGSVTAQSVQINPQIGRPSGVPNQNQ